MCFTKIKDLIANYENLQNNSLLSNDYNILNSIPDISKKGKLSVIVSRPGDGKSTFLLQMAICFAYFNNTPCYLFSPQMPTIETIQHIIKILPNGILLSELPIWIFNSETISINEIEFAVKSEIKDGIVLVDSYESVKSQSRRQTLTKLNILAKERNLPIVFSTSIFTAKEEKWYKSEEMCPRLADLPYLENVDNAVILYRESFYYKYNFVNRNANRVKVITVKSSAPENKINFLEWTPEKHCFRGNF